MLIATQQAEASFTFTQPATVPVVPTQPLVTMSNQAQKSPRYCVICTPTGKQCPSKYPMPLKSDWSDSEQEENETNKQNKVEEEIEDWDGNLQKQK